MYLCDKSRFYYMNDTSIASFHESRKDDPDKTTKKGVVCFRSTADPCVWEPIAGTRSLRS